MKIIEPQHLCEEFEEISDIATLEKRVEEGDSELLFDLGNIALEEGLPEKAVEFWEKAAQAGSPEAKCNLGILYENGDGVAQDLDKAREYYDEAARGGAEAAYYNMARLFDNPEYPDYDLYIAILLYKKAAETPDYDACYQLALLYEGEHEEKNLQKAAEWYKKGADAGHIPSQYNLGALLYHEAETEEQINEAVFWFEKAAAQGDEDAQDALEQIHDEE
ncbi:MAG: hypothetical protein CSA81_13570 [Acidobacteria bacterium]|nr:MAG: hypothetical protein CSA81_13570 [Acidobacteriota bacterium]